jgi:hypothetical protein
MYALFAAVAFGHSGGSLLRWGLLPVAPLAVVTAGIGLAAMRAAAAPPGGWHTLLGFPHASLVCVGVGMAAIQYFQAVGDPGQEVLRAAGSRGGAALIGAGVAFAAVQTRWVQALLAVPLAMFTALVGSYNSAGMLTVLYAATVTVWWARRLWRTARAALTPAAGAPGTLW